MGKLTISMAIFNSFLYVYQRVSNFTSLTPLHYLFYSWSFHRAWTKTLAAPDEPRFRSSVIPCLEWDRLFASTFPRRLPKYRWISYVNIFIYIYTGWGPSSLAKLVQKTIITIVHDTQITIFRWVYKPTYNWGAPSCIYIWRYTSYIPGKPYC